MKKSYKLFRIIPVAICVLMLLLCLNACLPSPGKNDNISGPGNNETETTPGPETGGGNDGSFPEPEPEPEPENKVLYIKSLVNSLNVRKSASAGSAVVGSMDRNDMLGYAGKSGNWYKVFYKNTEAYVSAKPEYTATVSKSAADEVIERVIAEGTKLLGTEYVYGAVRLHDGRGNFLNGFSSSAFDCSSFVQYIFYNGAGLLLDVTTRTQSVQGEPVSGGLKRGDVMFFTNASRYNNSGIERIGHVAVYLGDNYILHTASDYAVIEPISQQRHNYFLFSRRFV